MTIQIGQLIKVHHGYAFPGSGFGDDPLLPQVLTPGNFAPGERFRYAVKSFDGEVPDGYELEQGSLIVTMTDLSKDGGTLGLSSIVPADSKYLHNQRIGRVEVLAPAEIDTQFLHYLFHSRQYRDHVIATATGTTVRHTSPSRIEAFECDLPDKSTQSAIAGVLGALDDKIAANRLVQRSSRALARTVVERQKAVCRVADLASVSTGSIPPDRMDAPFVTHYSLPAFDQGFATVEQPGNIKSAKHVLTAPAVLVSKLNPRIPRIWAVDVLPQGIAVSSTEFVSLVPQVDVSVGELWAALLSPKFTERLLTHVAGTTGSHQRVRPADLLQVSVTNVRALPEAERELLRHLCRLTNNRTAENQRLAAARDELLPLLMSGKITVKGAEERVEQEA